MKIALRVVFSLGMLCATAMVTSSLYGATWWTGQTVHAGVELSSTRTLWQIRSEELVFGNVSHGGACASSDECLEGAWCRKGDGRCWTDSDCALASHRESPDEFCARLPRSKTLRSSCSCSKKNAEDGDLERAACNRIHAVRAVAVAAVTFAALSIVVAWIPCEHAGLVFSLAAVATGCELVAIWIAVGVEIAGARLKGLGFIYHCCGTFASAMAAAAALRWALGAKTSARQPEKDIEFQPGGSGESSWPSDQPNQVAAAAPERESSKHSGLQVDEELQVRVNI